MRWVLRAFGFVFVLVLVAVVSLIFLPTERLARIATDQLASLTGRDVSISGDVGITLWPVLGLRAEGLEVGGPEWAERGPLLQSSSAAIGIDARSLLKGDIRITNVEADSPTIRLEQKDDGRASWVFSDATGEAAIEANTPAPQTQETTAERSLHIEKMQITDATLIYDAEGSDLVQYQGVDLSLDWPNPDGAATVTAALQPGPSTVTVEAEIEEVAAFLRGDVQALRATLRTDAGRIDFDGRASTSGAVAGRIGVKTTSTDGFLRALGVAAVDLPPGLGRQIDLKTDLTLTPDRRLALRDLVVDLGGNRLSGAADIALDGVPKVNAQLNAGALNLRAALSAGADAPVGAGASSSASGSTPATPSASATSGQASGAWPTNTIDASGLSAFNGDIALTADSVDLGRFKLGLTRTVLRNDNSRMVFELREVQAYGGGVTGEFVINNRSGLSVGGRINAQSVQIQPILSDAIDVDKLTGTAALQLSFLGVGPSVDAIINSLSGDGNAAIGQGTIQGINLDRLMRGGDVGSGTTIFDSLTGSWTIAGGVLNNNDLLLQLKNYEARGGGRVGLGAQNIDYTFTPVALRANSGQGLAIPVRFVGPWSDVSIRPDLEAALDLQIDAEVDKIEAEAKEKIDQKIDQKVQDVLGVQRQEGQSLEDTVKDELKDKLLRKLFD